MSLQLQQQSYYFCFWLLSLMSMKSGVINLFFFFTKQNKNKLIINSIFDTRFKLLDDIRSVIY